MRPRNGKRNREKIVRAHPPASPSVRHPYLLFGGEGGRGCGRRRRDAVGDEEEEERTHEDLGNLLQDVHGGVGRGLFVFFLWWWRHVCVRDVGGLCWLGGELALELRYEAMRGDAKKRESSECGGE